MSASIVPLAAKVVAPVIVIPLDSVDNARAALNHVEVAAQLAQATLVKAPVYGEMAALTGVRQLLQALVCVLGG